MAKDAKEKSVLFIENEIEVLLNKPVKYVEDTEIILNAKLKKWQHEEYIDVIDDYVFDCLLSNEIKFHALFEAFYGLTNNFQLVWYLGSPLIHTDVNFDNYFDILKVGGEYAVTENGIIFSIYK